MLSFQSEIEKFKIKPVRLYKTWLLAIAEREQKTIGTITYVFMSDQQLLQHNQNFLQHNTYTDIITFDYCEGKTLNGDILISIDRVYDNAGKFGVDIGEELRRVMSHGLLHLCGYKDKKPDDQTLMRKKENQALLIWKKISAR